MALIRISLAVAKVELLRLLRSPTSFTLLLLVPALQILLFGYAIRPSAAEVEVAIAGPASARDDVARLARAAQLRVVRSDLAPAQAEAMVRAGKAAVAIELPTSPFQPVRTVIDATDPNLSVVAEARVEAIYWHALAKRNDVADYGPRLRIERLFNASARPDWAFLPALIGTIMMISMLMLGALSLARERELGTWEALAALPIGRLPLLLGKVVPLAVIGSLQGVIVLAASIWLFALPVRGNLFAFLALFPLFAAAHLVLSTLPLWAQRLGKIFPLTHFVRAARGATLRGQDGWAILSQGAPIGIFLLVVLAISLIQQRTRLD
jgi:ABC-2 type transport system permease protein